MGRVIVAQKHYKNMLRTVWHPEPLLDVIHTDHASIAVKAGKVRGQLSSAQFVEI